MSDAAQAAADGDYAQADLGMPEWFGQNRYVEPTKGGRLVGAGNGYRPIVAPYVVIQALAAHIYPGMAAAWGKQAFLDLADRYMERGYVQSTGDPLYVDKWARTIGGSDALTAFEVAAWDTWRASQGGTIWNWT